jgi:diguanylate cyclase (GGDEF)-like protein
MLKMLSPDAHGLSIRAGRESPQSQAQRQAAVHRRQCDLVFANFALGGVSAMLLYVGIALVFWPSMAHPGLALTLAAATLVNIVGWVWGRRVRQRPPTQPVPPGEYGRLLFHLGTIGVLTGALGFQLMSLSSGDLRLPVVWVWVVAVAVGWWIAVPVRAASLAWALGATLTCAAGLWMWPLPEMRHVPWLLLVYATFLAAASITASGQVRQRLEAEYEVMQQKQLIGLLLDDFESNASDWLWETDAHGQLTHVSPRLSELLGQEPAALIGRSLVHLTDQRAAAELGEPAVPAGVRTPNPLGEALGQGLAFRGVVVDFMLQGQRRWWSMSARPLRADDGRLTGWRGVGSDISLLRQRELALLRQANIDSLTGLANRHCFGQALADHFGPARRPCALLMLDLDNFKMVNDALGHAVGDQVLQQLGARLQQHVPAGWLLARLGGDEFAVLASGRHEPEALRHWGQAVREALAQPLELAGRRLEMRVSIGAALAPGDADDAEQLLLRSDLALYAAKAAGRHTMRFFEPALESAASGKIALLSDLRQALQLEQLSLDYQPQVCLRTGQVMGFEALVRWRHPVRGFVSPADFIPLAEESGLILPLGRWVLNRACRDAMTWPAPLRVAVNLSATELQRADLLKQVDEALLTSRLPAQRLELELTESTLLNDAKRGIALLTQLRERGIRIALDDFGTGFSSLAYLRTLPLDKLKIDRSFVRTLSETQDEAARTIVRAIQQLASGLQLEMTAEGVEDQTQNRALADIGCDYGQGYLYARPMNATAVLPFLNRAADPAGSAGDAATAPRPSVRTMDRPAGPNDLRDGGPSRSLQAMDREALAAGCGEERQPIA